MKTILFFLAITLMGSCKKEYHCSCEFTTPQGSKYNTVTLSFKDTERGAAEACQKQEEYQSGTCVVVPE